jgi:hypothetical protein
MISNGKLTQIGASFRVSNKHGSRTAVFLCECGQNRTIDVKNVRTGRTKSCGCSTGRSISERKITHGKRHTKTYASWTSMRSRCRNENNPAWDNYGGRGILLCDRWEEFRQFFEDMGECPDGMSIDRIDNDGNYEPDNCRWATRKEQSRNKRTSKMITANGKTMCVAAWSEETGINQHTIGGRIRLGWPDHDAVNTPLNR